ncbi:MAG: carboxypeptidase-like regulatory domain-containing protein, partial [Chitinophagaceae bacterium]|nr:carboxypeptidase-like regulatory domain-containing protein [Chitinophagaceae bacterium]
DAAYRETDNDFEADTIKSVFNQQYFKLPDNARSISGQVTSDGKPVVGVSVLLRNTNYGTITNSNGYYSIKVPEKGILRFASVGFEPQEISIEGKQFIEVKLRENTAALNEVVVVGYGVRMKKMMTGSVSIVSNSGLQGKVAGVLIRGISGANGNSKPLLIVDGYPVDKQLSELDASDIQSTQVLKADIATGIYGARAANGVIIITTKKAAAAKTGPDEKSPEATPGNTLRTHFRDEAYWFPSLRTNAKGKASATVVFPDDITNWKTFAIAVTENKQIGMASANVRSFKAISATLHLPNFAVAGDEMQVLGKAMNYGFDSMQLKQSFLVNGKEISSATIGVKNSHIDTFPVVASGDSLKLAYTIQRNDGYFDGEERKLTIFPQGVTETNGMFAALNKDSVINWQPSSGSEVTFHAEGSVLPVLMDEIEYVYKYEYSCNEQLASKLKALLMKRRLYASLKKDFKQDKQIREIISQLNKSKANDNLWGWWKDGASQSWITLHVIDALLLAGEQQFETGLNRTLMKDYLVYSLDRAPVKISMQLPALRILRKLDAKILFRPWLDSLAKKDTVHSFYETLSLISFEQDLDAKPVPDSLLAKQRRTVFGNIYWGEEGYHFFDNSIQNTLLMYKILKTAGGNEALLQKIRQYFLEKRRSGHWRNTYESILILETILPDLLNEPAFSSSSTLVLRQGDQVQTVSDYPFTLKLNNREPIRVEKKGGQPVYLTTYQNKWNPEPKKVDSTFAVSSYFVTGKDTLNTLKAGEPVVLHVNVKVSADAAYVMLEIPVPAGCSYGSKPQSWLNNEVHREYFLNKVSIFCSELKKGNYNFTVSLLPRYTGKYNLNPAKASMMYFPVFFGREGIKTVNIR